MGIMISRRVASIAAAAAVSGLVLAGCSTDSDSDSDMDTAAEGTTSSMMTTAETSETSAMAAPGGMLVGAGCTEYAEANPTGPGSVEGMAMEPVATAASNNPLLTTLTAAVSGGVNPDVDLVDTLNGGEFTVFAPVDAAFAEIDDATMAQLQTDPELLTSILTYHVVEGQITPDEIVGMQTTLNGADVDVTGSGDALMVNGATVVCGGVETANATVYLVDQVLIPEE